MSKNCVISFFLLSLLFITPGLSMAGGDHTRAKWVDISNDKKFFDKNCDYKVWLLENNEWTETWYLEAFDAQNAFYTINRQSSSWSETDAFYALNYKDKTKFLIGEKFIDVVTFSLCLNSK